jgi:chromosome segregation ATPase
VDRFNRVSSTNSKLYGQQFGRYERAEDTTAFDPFREHDLLTEKRVEPTRELFGILDPYLEEQKKRMAKLIEHESSIIKLGQNETEKVLRDRINLLNEENGRIKEELSSLKSKLASAKATSNTLKSETEAWQQERSDLLRNLSVLQDRLQSGEDATTTTLLEKSRELVDAKTKISLLERDQDSVMRLNRELEAETKILRDELAQWGGYVKHDRVKMEEQMAITSAEKLDVELKLSVLKKEKEELEDKYLTETEGWNREAEEFAREKTGLQKEVGELRDQLENHDKEFSNYRQIYDKIKFNDLEKEVEHLKAVNSEQEGKLIALDKSTIQKIKTFEELIRKKDQEIEAKRQEIGNGFSAAKDWEREKKKLMEKIEDIQREADNAKEDAKLQIKLATMEASQGEGAVNESRQMIEGMQREIERLRDELDAANKKVVAASSINSPENVSPVNASPTQSSRHFQLQNAQEPQPEQSQMQDNYKDLLKRRDEKIKQLSAELKSLKEELEKAQSNPGRANLDAQSPTSSPNRGSPEKSGMEDADRKMYEAEIAALNDRIRELEAIIAGMKRSTAAATAGLAAAQAQSQTTAANTAFGGGAQNTDKQQTVNPQEAKNQKSDPVDNKEVEKLRTEVARLTKENEELRKQIEELTKDPKSSTTKIAE